jgi:hypothetical protein
MADVADSAHARAPLHMKDICNLLAAGMRQHIPDSPANLGKNWCTVGKPGVAFVQHTRTALNVFLRCVEADHDQLSSLLIPNSTLSLLERKSLTSPWAKSTPYSLRITTPEESTSTVPLLVFLAQRSARRKGAAIAAMPSEDSAEHWEGNRAVIYVNRFERDPKARAACIKVFGTSCAVCKFDFGDAFGEIGKGFIHVHHLKPLSEMGVAHKVNPKKDMRPVCPNCHEMLHRRTPPFSVEELRSIRNWPN